MNKLCFVNGSPRGKNSGSKCIIDIVSEMLDRDKFEIHEACIIEDLNSSRIHSEFDKLLMMDTIIFVFPLYIDAIPSSMLDYLYQLEEYLGNINYPAAVQKHPRVYSIINNGFIEGGQNVNAIRIMRHFAGRTGFDWRFGIGLGAGEFFKETVKNIPMTSKLKLKQYNAISKLVKDIENDECAIEKDIFASPSMPKAMFMFMANMHWTRAAKKSRKELSRRPY